MSTQRDRRLRAAVGPAQRRAGAAATGRSTGCASRGSTARRSSPGCSATQAGHWSLRAPDADVGHPSLRRSHHGVGDDVPHRHRDRGRRRRAWRWARATAGTSSGSDAPHLLLRQVTCTAGEVEIELEYVPRPEYGLVVPLLDAVDGGLVATGGADVLVLSCPRARDGRRVVGVGPVRASVQGEQACFALHHSTAGRRRDGPGVERSPRSRRGSTTRWRRGSRGRSCTRPTSVRGATWSTTADGCSRRCRSSPPARSAPRPPRRCPRSSAARGTGTTATRGSATRRSRSRRCGWRRVPTRRTSSSTP